MKVSAAGIYIDGDIAPVIDGFVVANGNASNVVDKPGYGGGIFSNEAAPTIANNIIRNNIANENDDASSVGYGGGIHLQYAHAPALIQANLIASNTASTAGGQGRGGGVHITYSEATIRHNSFRGNTAGATTNSQGGGLFTYESDVEVHGNFILNNKGTSKDDGFGAGFYAQFGALTLDANTVISNAAEYGAITLKSNEAVTLTNNIVANNVGGIFLAGNATFPLTGTLVHNTIAGNENEGVYVGYYSSGYASVVMTNNIIVGQTTGVFVYQDPNISNKAAIDHTLFYDNDADTGGAGIISSNVITGQPPLFVDPAAGNFHLRALSPAVDAGALIPWLVTDFDGDTRPSGHGYDIGADERVSHLLYWPLVEENPD